MELEESCSNDSYEERRTRRLEECSRILQGYPGLIKRSFVSVSPEKLGIGLDVASTRQDKLKSPLRVMQYNILADALAYTFPDNFTRVPSACLLWKSRKERIIEQILSLNPDIVCLEEVDHFEDVFQPLFLSLGYKSFFFPKNESPCLKMEGNNGPDGISLFYRSSRLDHLDIKMRYLKNTENKESNQPVITCMLFDKVYSRNICVAVTHFKAKKGFEELRSVQAKDTLKAVVEIRKDIDTQSAVLVCGDFNGEPSEKCYSAMESHSEISLESAYKKAMKNEISFTTWKTRDVEVKKAIDYIWFNPDKMQIVSYLATPSEEDVPEERFPSFSCPSDHLALCCDFIIN